MTRFLLLAATLCVAASASAEPIKTLLIDGQNNHQWKLTTPEILDTLESGGLCEVTVLTAPDEKGDMASFNPKFEGFDVVVSNYNGEPWNEATQTAFDKYVAGGGGFVSVHAADNSFPSWEAYNRMIGLGGWGGRNENSGPYVRWKDDLKKFTRDSSRGNGGTHGQRTPFLLIVRDADHPITIGLPRSFMQTEDELYGKLRGPAENMHILATAFSETATGGTGEHEPILMTIHYGTGRVFHTTLGHDVKAMQGLAFQTTLRRGTQWAATGNVVLAAVDAKQLPADRPAEGNPNDVSNVETGAAKEAKPSDEPATAKINWDAVPDLKSDGWVALFDGETLEGWTQKNGTATYRVDAETIIGKTATGSPNSFLTTNKNYKDFELSFEVNVDPKLNSGVQFRSATREDGGRVYGPQVEIEQSPGEAGYIYGEATGRDWITTEQPIKDAYQNGKFNRYTVRAIGDRMQTWIGDKKIADIVDPESNNPGFIGLQVHGIGQDEGPYEVRWRNIKVREL